ncbi:hypothetical protein INR49_002301 [Caranx melampygus]|nr:hypothetical protein INR49_002301 [Caranx melampygus]
MLWCVSGTRTRSSALLLPSSPTLRGASQEHGGFSASVVLCLRLRRSATAATGHLPQSSSGGGGVAQRLRPRNQLIGRASVQLSHLLSCERSRCVSAKASRAGDRRTRTGHLWSGLTGRRREGGGAQLRDDAGRPGLVTEREVVVSDSSQTEPVPPLRPLPPCSCQTCGPSGPLSSYGPQRHPGVPQGPGAGAVEGGAGGSVRRSAEEEGAEPHAGVGRGVEEERQRERSSGQEEGGGV